MAIKENGVITYTGCVLNIWERNGRDDSDFYATVWDEEKGKVIDVMYDTTRCGGFACAEIDATKETLRKAYRYFFNDARKFFDEVANEAQARRIAKGCSAVVVRGRKIKKGTVGEIFWVGSVYNYYTYRNEDRVGILVDGQKVFLPLDYVQKINWESEKMTGETRKEAIRKMARKAMPFYCNF